MIQATPGCWPGVDARRSNPNGCHRASRWRRRYTSAIVVPADAPLGTVQVCAALSGTEQTAFSCIDFTVDSPPPGHVQGQITLSNQGSTVDRGV